MFNYISLQCPFTTSYPWLCGHEDMGEVTLFQSGLYASISRCLIRRDQGLFLIEFSFVQQDIDQISCDNLGEGLHLFVDFGSGNLKVLEAFDDQQALPQTLNQIINLHEANDFNSRSTHINPCLYDKSPWVDGVLIK